MATARTILDPYATHVGIGVAWEGGEFRITQEFIRRYVDWIASPAARGETSRCSAADAPQTATKSKPSPFTTSRCRSR